MTTAEQLNDLIARADEDGLPELRDLLAASVIAESTQELPLTVGQAAELLGLSAHTLRYYERIGLVDVGRSGSGQRRYDREALARVIFISRLRLSGMSINDIAEYIGLVEQGSATEDQRLELLYRHRAKVQRQLEELRFTMAVIDYKITTYGGSCGS